MLTPRECGHKLVVEAEKYPVALVFGRENNGLSNEELQQCHYHVCIPANPEYSSLNIAAAVQTLCYEIRVNHLDIKASQHAASAVAEYPLSEDLERFYAHLEKTLKQVDFIVANHPGMVMTKLRRLFNRARPEVQELNILRGILASIDKNNPNKQMLSNEKANKDNGSTK